MKKLIFFLPLVLLFFVTCKKDKAKDKTVSEFLVGNWTVVAFGEDSNNDFILQDSEKSPIPAASSLVETFNADGTGTITATAAGNPPSPIIWSAQNNSTTLTINDGTNTTLVTLLKINELELSGYDASMNPHQIFILNK
ncbi:MAG: hypothetical protein JSS98_17040 [Bacteroidetes bacterium]|nr:hypothetical protein [Bacteroidota bacterium]